MHDKADLIANRRLVDKQNEKYRPSEKGLARVQWQGQSTPASFKAARDPVHVHLPQYNPENRYSQFISADLGSLQHTANEFDESEDKVKQLKVKSSSRLKDKSGSAPKNSLSSHHSPLSPRNEASKKNGSKGSRYETHSNHIQSRTASHK